MFRHFSAAEINSFAEIGHGLRQFEKNDVIINEGDRLTSLYLLIKGTILITKTGYQTPISRLTPGAVFGEMSFLTKKPRFSNVIANEPVQVMKMDDDFFNVVSIEVKDKIKDYLIELLINRLDTMNESISKIAKYTRTYTIK